MSNVFESLKREVLRAEAGGLSRAELCRRSKVAEGVLSRFMAGTRGLSVEVVERLADGLEMELTLRPKAGRKGR